MSQLKAVITNGLDEAAPCIVLSITDTKRTTWGLAKCLRECHTLAADIYGAHGVTYVVTVSSTSAWSAEVRAMPTIVHPSWQGMKPSTLIVLTALDKIRAWFKSKEYRI